MRLHYAAKWGDTAALRKLVAAGRSVDERSAEGKTPLMYAVASRHASRETIEALLEIGADVNATSTLEYTPLVLACDAERMLALLAAGADPLFVSASGYGALLHAPLTVPCQRLLLERGADPNQSSSYGETPLGRALFQAAHEVVSLLLEHGAKLEELGLARLCHAILAGSVTDVRRALLAGAEPHDAGSKRIDPWSIALRHGDLGKIRLLHEAGADPMRRGPVGQTSLMQAAQANQTDVVRWLHGLGHGLDERDQFGGTALIRACEAGATEAVRALLEAGADVEATDHVGTKPIDCAANLAIVEMLVAREVDLDYVNGQGYGLLKIATENGDEEFARGLIAMGANVDATSTGDTALHMAARYDERLIVQMLLEAGANPNAQDVDGWTPLHATCSPETATMLLRAGADPTISDQAGTTPLSLRTEAAVASVLAKALKRN